MLFDFLASHGYVIQTSWIYALTEYVFVIELILALVATPVLWYVLNKIQLNDNEDERISESLLNIKRMK
jgi:hypothetical protein